MPNDPVRVQLSESDAKGNWADVLLSAAEAALLEAEAALGLKLVKIPLVESIAPEPAFYEALGRRPHNLAAVAIAHENRIVINRAAWIAMSRRARRQVLVHEFTHLLLGRRLPTSLPRWLDEGLAMIASGETSFRYHTRVATAATFGHLIPLEELGGASFGVRDQELAYAQSLSATRFVLRSGVAGTRPGLEDPALLVERLASAGESGQALRRLLADPNYIRRLDHEWRRSIRTVWTWIAAMTGSSVFWIAATGLFLLAYWRKKRMADAKLREWAETDPWHYDDDDEDF